MSNDEDTVDFEAGSFGLVDGKMVKVCLDCEGAAKFDIEVISIDNPKLHHVHNWVCRKHAFNYIEPDHEFVYKIVPMDKNQCVIVG